MQQKSSYALNHGTMTSRHCKTCSARRYSNCQRPICLTNRELVLFNDSRQKSCSVKCNPHTSGHNFDIANKFPGIFQRSFQLIEMEGREASGQLAPCEQLSVQQRSFSPSSGEAGSEKEKDSCVVPSEADQLISQNFPPVLTFPLCQGTVFRLIVEFVPPKKVTSLTRQLSAVLLCGSGPLPAGQVRGAWSAYLDTVVEPTG